MSLAFLIGQSVLDASGPQSARIAALWWFFFYVCAAIFALVIGTLVFAIVRWRRSPVRAGLPPQPGDEARLERRMTSAVSGATIATVLTVFVLLLTSVSAGNAISDFASPHGLVVEITGHQWWWEARYPNPDASKLVVTANEIHIPVGRPVMFRATSSDVIHSLWIPSLHGKKDLIPSRVTTTWMQADKPGLYRGQCAEFCGFQHAHMGLLVVAEPEAEFNAWLEQQLRPAAEPANDAQRRGREVFLSSACVLCHTVRGTGSWGQVAPDLTHVAGRKTIAAGALANTAGHLGGWIEDSQSVKPGNHMPPINLAASDVQPLLEYLGSLK